MRLLFAAIAIFLLCVSADFPPSDSSTYPIGVQKLMAAYPLHVAGYEDGFLIFHDQSRMRYDDGQSNKTHAELLENPDLKDMFAYPYPKGVMTSPPERNQDPGRIRNTGFYKKIYGQTREEVESHLTEIIWCPQTIGHTLRVTTVNNVDKQLLKISEQLDKHPEWEACIRAVGRGFNWRPIARTDRLSAHSFGIAIDLNRSCSDYWLWDYPTADENTPIIYKNRLPLEIVEIFEQHGF
ncbi:MAG: M15 family metallopeptidase, partial [Bacteroidales bacterium]|nr:M15 family metallopeptidase [Bacteroidales bacterium]